MPSVTQQTVTTELDRKDQLQQNTTAFLLQRIVQTYRHIEHTFVTFLHVDLM